MRILITGICGFVGTHLATGLRRRRPDARIFGIDSFVRPGSEQHRQVLAEAGVSFTHGDVRCASDLERFGDCDWVIDAAANPSVLAGIDGRTSTRQLIEHNLLGTVNILEFCAQRRAGLVLLSTSRVYSITGLCSLPLRIEGDTFIPNGGPWPEGASARGITESFSTSAPISLYGATKLASEALALEYHHSFGLPVVINRCGVIAGAGQFGTAEQGIFSFWVGAWKARRPLKYIGFGGSGAQVRDALHPDDLTELVHRQISGGVTSSGIWNAGGGPARAMSLAALSRWCGDRLGPHDVGAQPEGRPLDVPWVVIDSRRAEERFQWEQRWSLDATLDAIASHYSRHPDWLDRSKPYA